jgi:glyoxylase-like metal-dependent hydrolase (beta-lactamase superfamily II)
LLSLIRLAVAGIVACCSLGWTHADSAERLQQIAPGVLRSTSLPAAHVLFENRSAVIIGCPQQVTPEDLQAAGIETCKLVLLTHHHRDSVAGSQQWLARGAAVRASAQSERWLKPQGVAQFWESSLPAVVPENSLPCFTGNGPSGPIGCSPPASRAFSATCPTISN